MKTTCLPSFACLLAVCGLVLAGTAQAATFQFRGGTLFTQVNQDQPVADVRSDWADIPGGKVLAEAEIEYVAALAAGMVRSGAEVEGIGTGDLLLNMGAVVFGNSQQGGRLEMTADAATVAPGLAGLFFEIVPSAGESLGDSGRLMIEATASGQAGPNAIARIDRGFSPSMALTLNDFPPSDPLSGIVWEHEDILLNEGESLYLPGYVGIIDYHIGDTIGIHLGLGVELTLTEAASGFADVSALIRMRIVPEPVAVGLLVMGGLMTMLRRQR